MRWSYLIPRLIIVALIWAFFTFGFDPALRYGATETLQSVTGAKADVGSIQTGFFPPRVFVDGVALANRKKPGTNLVEFDKLTLNLGGQALLRRSYVVEEATVTGVRFGTDRDDDGQLERSEDEDGGPLVPPWMQEKLKNFGDEWLEEFTQQAKSQLDPNRLESYRVGNEIYEKWDQRFEEYHVYVNGLRAEVVTLKKQIAAAKTAEPMEQIDAYLQIAQRADLLMRQSRSVSTQMQRNVPLEVKTDFARLDQAQKNDREQVSQTIHLLKPDARRISESLIGEEMYLQLQELLSWVEMARRYQDAIKAPPEPERNRGRDIAFEIFNPTPKVLCRKMLMNGELMLGDTPTPFSAVLTNATSDPKLLGKPAVLQVSAAAETPIQVVVRHDATGDVAQTFFAADYTDPAPQQLVAGKADRDRLSATISNMHWKAQLTLVSDEISGEIDVTSTFGDPDLQVTSEAATLLAGLTEQTLGGISEVNARLALSGPITKPQVDVTSDLGDQIVAGFQAGFSAFVPEMQNHLRGVIDDYVAREKKQIAAKLGGRYKALAQDNQKVLDSLNEAHSIAMDLREGKLDAQRVFRLASDSGVLKEKEQKKVGKYLDKHDKVMKGLQNPQQTLQDALPGLTRKLFQ